MIPYWPRIAAIWLLGQAAASGQPIMPEQPAWGQSTAVAPSPVHSTAPVPANIAPMPTASATASGAGSSMGPTFSLPTGGASFQNGVTQAPSSTNMNGTSTMGVPQAENSYLPRFDDYGKPFFERDGLRFRVGPVNFRMSLGIDVGYNDNIFGTHTNPVADLITAIGPNFLLGMGDFTAKSDDFLLLNYQPSFQYYTTYVEQNRLNQSLDLSAQATFSRYSTTVDLTYVNNDEPNATQNNRQNYQVTNFMWKNTYSLTAKTFGRLDFSAVLQNYENGDNYTTYTASPLLGYEISPKTTVFFGPFAGIAYIASNGDEATGGTSGTQTFQGFSLGINYSTLRKLKFEFVGGVQSRQYNGNNQSGASNFTTPVFNFNMTYTPTEKTDIGLGLSRDVELTDLLQGSTYTNNQLQMAITHRLLPHITLGLTLNYQYLQYQGDFPAGNRTDTFVSASPTITYTFWRDFCSFALYYRRLQRTSTVASAGYDNNVYGIQFQFKF